MIQYRFLVIVLGIGYSQKNQEYFGPASTDYFQSELESLNLNNLQHLECNVRYSGYTTKSNPVQYYILDLTQEMILQNPAGIGISTCCNPYDTDYDYNATYLYSWYKWYNEYKLINNISNDELFNNHRYKSEIDWIGYCGFDELWPEFFTEPINSTWTDIQYFYNGYSCGENKYCDINESLDTSIYIISEKKNRFFLIDYIDDNDADYNRTGCDNAEKSIFDLSLYNPDKYIIAIAGFYNETGEFEVDLYCNNQYSFPIKESEIVLSTLNETNIDELYCGVLLEKQLNDIHHLVSYYKFIIDDKMNAPITITTCNGEYNASNNAESLRYYDAYLYLITADGVILSESDESAICQDYDYRPADLVLNDLDEFQRNKEYFIIVQGYENDLSFKPYSISMTCGPKYSFPIKAVQIDLTKSIVHDIECFDELQHQQLYENGTVSFYTFNVLKYMYPPIIINVWNDDDDMYKISLISNDFIVYQSDSFIEMSDLSMFQNGNQLILSVQRSVSSAKHFSISMECGTQYSFPISQSEFNEMNTNMNWIDINVIECGAVLEEEYNDYMSPISFYTFNITESMYPPVIISTCNEEENDITNLYDSYMYLLQSNDKQISILDESYHSTSCGDSGVLKWNPSEIIIDRNDLNEMIFGEYIVIVQGYNNKFGMFSINMKCGSIPKLLNTKSIVTGMSVLLFVIGISFIIWYVYKWINYREQTEETESKTKGNKDKEVKTKEIETETGIELINYISDAIKVNSSSSLHSDVNHGFLSMKHATTRRIAYDENLDDLTSNDDEDKIQRLLSHVLQCCEEEDALDVYQVLAVRYLDKKSREIQMKRPLKAFGINVSIITLSLFHQSLFVAIITGLLQTMGISVVVFKLIKAYFQEVDYFWDNCSMDANRWNQIYSLKILSFLWSFVITFSIHSGIRGIKHDGFYQIISSIKKDEIPLLNKCVCFEIIRFGQIINYYACLLSVIGSFFIIYETNKGELEFDGEIDFSHSALDMVLNAVALFFMLELDDFLVQYADFRDIERSLEAYSVKYVLKMKRKAKSIKDSFEMGSTSKCINTTTNTFAFFVKTCLYAFGAVAPIFIFFCY